ncbi:ribonuclease J [Halobacteriovorax sp. GB3]|uniref:ribonuclease J n=1 Tax=Halobacteriovorax sp. GB3 TaxID=2719615 RepID=UPI00235E07C2|nr:ribonuclease J [Halobacteriovorax sp. GB3]MDD0854652.1 ribonuclease J [Halobacteriovorax sp. GB3]
MLEIRPIGGVGQIGSNSTLIKTKKDCFLIDCGILFPYEDFFDLNYLIPDLSFVEDKPTKLIITHGHEDHIGAIVHFLESYPQIEVWAPEFAKLLIEKKLARKKLSKKVHVYKRDSKIELDDTTIIPIQVNHSIPDTYGILVNNEDKSLFLVSDFKIDEKPIYEPDFDFEKLLSYSKGKTKILLADSTNILSNNLKTPSEESLISDFESIIKNSNERLFVTTFASNIFRIKTILDLAKKLGRRVVPHGRSMISYIDSAIEAGIITDTSVLRDVDSIDPNDKKLIVLLTGCQGDFKGSFRRVAIGEDSRFKINQNDTFILSSKSIPGNEKKISLLLNSIYSFNAKAITVADANIHVSGHPGKRDLEILYSKFDPNIAIPIHGETAFIHKHVDWIKDKFPKTKPITLKNFDKVIFDNNKVKIEQVKDSPEPLLIHGNYLVIEKTKISERRKLACNGAIFISINKDSLAKRRPQINVDFMGLPLFIDNHKESFEEFLKTSLKDRKIKLIEKTQEEIRIETRRYFNNILGYKPITTVHFV